MKLLDAQTRLHDAGFETYTAGHGVLFAGLTNRRISTMEVKLALAPETLGDDGIEFDQYGGEVAITGLDLDGWQ